MYRHVVMMSDLISHRPGGAVSWNYLLHFLFWFFVPESLRKIQSLKYSHYSPVMIRTLLVLLTVFLIQTGKPLFLKHKSSPKTSYEEILDIKIFSNLKFSSVADPVEVQADAGKETVVEGELRHDLLIVLLDMKTKWTKPIYVRTHVNTAVAMDYDLQ